ncbi:hypothetical protein CH373_18355 [Leptospira perolatii]|uniref:Anti-bacteriophage protein A/HamA C-terminal domain-containing protein n=1 Tax=Leptospira perolatii TaxID=2023191 RepID=A0A2M9ZHW3_9LEPT|nr:DUF1837 domain-containing protein [Leptospira perolatii]PJZ70812.1 hypothetical protein CH360_04685 [Leptospira perolatii]PJZ71648.1 hypothetical protein CH373_18355 [Leptospira perolatii]
MNNKPFQSDRVLEETIAEGGFKAFKVGFDQKEFRMQPLADVIASVIPEFALGHYELPQVPVTDIRSRLKQAAIKLYTTDKYQKRGEFGEVILHLLLRDFCESFPLISKINFKDATNSTVKGFDGVHIIDNGTSKKLLLGESKIYSDGKEGIKSLTKDLKQHLTEDYLRKEFLLISPKISENVPDREHWINLMHEHTTLDQIFSGICIPLVCTYSSPCYTNHCENTKEFLNEFIIECKSLKQEFDSNKIQTDVDIILMLLPVQDKAKLTDELHSRLRSMQSI